MILKPFPGCVSKLSMGRIQTGYMDFLPLQFCERSWKVCRLSVQTCSLQLISFLDLKYPSSYLFKTFFVDFDLCVSYLLGAAPSALFGTFLRSSSSSLSESPSKRRRSDWRSRSGPSPGSILLLGHDGDRKSVMS